MDILCNNINCDGIGMRRADWDNFRECKDIVLNGQVIWTGNVLSPAVKSQIYTEYAANPILASQIWKAANVYAKANPTTIPIINAHPKAYHACIDYVTEGLVFQMDCDWLCTAAEWKDRIGNIIFAGTNVQLQDGIPYFNGSAYMVSNSLLQFPINTSTIEIVYRAEQTSVQLMFYADTQSLAMGILSASQLLAVSGTSISNCYMVVQSHTRLNTASFRTGLGCINGSQVQLSGNDKWETRGSNKTWIGTRNGENKYKGKILAIRAYNRQLSLNEILANQTADLFRWN